MQNLFLDPPVNIITTTGSDTYSYTFPINATNQIACFFQETPTSPQVQLSPAMVTINIGTPGGTVVFTTGLAAGGTLVLERVVPYNFSTNFSAVGSVINGPSLDYSFTILEWQIQQLAAFTNYLGIGYPITSTQEEIGNKNIVPILQNGQFWACVAGSMQAVDYVNPPDVNTLRQELASQTSGSDGALLVGYYDASTSSGKTVHEKLNELSAPKSFIGDRKFSEQTSDHDGWMLENGRAISRVNYAAYYNLVGTRWGAGDGSTTFNIRNSDGRMIVGSGEAFSLGQQGGNDTATLSIDNIPNHSHIVLNQFGNPIKRPSVYGSGPLAAIDTGTEGPDEALETTHIGSGTSFSILNPYSALNSFVYVGQPAA